MFQTPPPDSFAAPYLPHCPPPVGDSVSEREMNKRKNWGEEEYERFSLGDVLSYREAGVGSKGVFLGALVIERYKMRNGWETEI